MYCFCSLCLLYMVRCYCTLKLPNYFGVCLTRTEVVVFNYLCFFDTHRIVFVVLLGSSSISLVLSYDQSIRRPSFLFKQLSFMYKCFYFQFYQSSALMTLLRCFQYQEKKADIIQSNSFLDSVSLQKTNQFQSSIRSRHAL